MGQVYHLTTEERARIEEIKDSLIELYVKQKEAIAKEKKGNAGEIEREIKKLRREMAEIKGWAKV